MERLGTQVETTANGETNPGSVDTLTQHTDTMQNMDNNNDRSLGTRAVNERTKFYSAQRHYRATNKPISYDLCAALVGAFSVRCETSLTS